MLEMNTLFAKQLGKVFQPHPSENKPKEEEALIENLETLCQLEPPNQPSQKS
jgi:hypothetical protein